MVLTTHWVTVSMTETLWSPKLLTYARLPSGLICTLRGRSPTVMHAASLVTVSMTDSEQQLVTYACKLSGVSVKASGASRSAMVVRQRLARSTADTNSDVHPHLSGLRRRCC